jgi:hypothetical protein
VRLLINQQEAAGVREIFSICARTETIAQAVKYDPVTRQVSVSLRDGSRFVYSLPAQPERRLKAGRVPAVSRTMALAICYQELAQERKLRSYEELAELGPPDALSCFADTAPDEPSPGNPGRAPVSTERDQRVGPHHRRATAEYRQGDRLGRADPSLSILVGRIGSKKQTLYCHFCGHLPQQR